MDKHFLKLDFQRSDCVPTLYKKEHGKNHLLVCIYVDDIIYVGSSQSQVEDFKQDMMSTFEMTDLGLLHYFLGLEIMRSKGCVFVSQKRYAMDFLNKYNMQHLNAASTPMDINEKLQLEDGSGETDGKRYHGMVGSLIYLSHSPPDIFYSVGVVSRFMNNPSKLHAAAVKRIMRYIAGTTEYGLLYEKVSDFKLTRFSDSD